MEKSDTTTHGSTARSARLREVADEATRRAPSTETGIVAAENAARLELSELDSANSSANRLVAALRKRRLPSNQQ